MRGHLNIAGTEARKNVRTENVRNPHLLVHSDKDAFETVREYVRCLEYGATEKAQAIRDANKDLAAYFNFADREWITKHGQPATA
jgi:hypothetical protein